MLSSRSRGGEPYLTAARLSPTQHNPSEEGNPAHATILYLSAAPLTQEEERASSQRREQPE